MKPRLLCSGLLILLMCSFSAHAADAKAEAEKLAAEYFEASRALDWAKASSYMHPEALAAFQRIMGMVVESDPSGEAGRQMLGLSEGQSFKDLTPPQTFQRLMGSLMEQVPMMKDLMASSRFAILGTLTEGELIHVVYRINMGSEDGSMSKVAIVTWKRDGAVLKALLTADMEGTLSKLAQSVRNK
ncbi:MAG: hypothetical protein ACREAA_07520 [Candidatus Polarisedimenticolia bacterium]